MFICVSYVRMCSFYIYNVLIHEHLQQDNYQKFNDGNNQDKFLHSSFERSEGKHICSYNTCGTCELQEIELCLRLRSFVIYIFIFV